MYRDLQPPEDQESEAMVLGAILLDTKALGKVIPIIDPRDFCNEKHRWIYEACLKIHNRGENHITPGLLTEELRQAQRLGAFSERFFQDILERTPTSVGAEHYASILHRLSAMRELIYTAEKIMGIGYECPPTVNEALDRAEGMIEAIRHRGTGSRLLHITNPRIIQTNPPRYKFNINGRDVRLTIGEMSSWLRFRTKVIASLNFVTLKPQNWDKIVSDLLQSAYLEEAPVDASEEQQVKIYVAQWFERMRETDDYTGLRSGQHVVKEISGKEYYLFQSTPLLRWLKDQLKKGISSEDLWVMVKEWKGIRTQQRVGKQHMPAKLWGIPLNFMEEAVEEESVEKEEEDISWL